MKRLCFLRSIAAGVILVLLALGCSGGSDSPASPGLTDSRTVSITTIALGDAEIAGDELTIPVLLDGINDIYAISFRIGFDPNALMPIGVDWTDSLEDEDATFQMLDRSGFVPLAFARFSGNPGLEAKGTLCTVRFRVIDPENATSWIVPDDSYLVAYNYLGDRLNLQTGGEAR